VFRLHEKRIASAEVIDFLAQLLRHHARNRSSNKNKSSRGPRRRSQENRSNLLRLSLHKAVKRAEARSRKPQPQ